MERFTVDVNALPQLLVVRNSDAEKLTEAVNEGIRKIKKDGGLIHELRFSPSLSDAQGSSVQFMTAIVLYESREQK